MTRLFNLDFQLLHDTILMAISVFVLFTVMSYNLFEPVRKMLKGRQEKIKTELESAASDQAEAAELRQQYEEKLKNVDKEAEVILSEPEQSPASMRTASLARQRKRLRGLSGVPMKRQNWRKNA